MTHAAPLSSALAVFIGSGLGGVLRWWMGWAVGPALGRLGPPAWSGFAGTWLVNVVGSLLLAALLAQSSRLPQPVVLVLGTGMMGGFTTYSTFNAEVLRAASNGQALAALGYASWTLVSCLGAGGAGWWLSKSLTT